MSKILFVINANKLLASLLNEIIESKGTLKERKKKPENIWPYTNLIYL